MVNSMDTLDFIIEYLTKLLIKQDIEDKKKGTTTYVKKIDCYKSLIKFCKDYKNNFESK